MYSDSEDKKPSISTRLSNILKDYLNLPGPLVHVQPYSLADSPSISFSVKDLEIIELPLDAKDAQAMSARADSISEPFYRSSPRNVHLPPDWDSWMSETVIPTALQTLGLGDYKCNFELLEMEIQSPGNPTRQAAKRSKKLLSSMPIIGSLEVLLPCKFTGGQLTISRPSFKPGFVRRVNCDENSSNILVIASSSHAGMRHSFDAIRSGFRVSLVYALKSGTIGNVRDLDFFFATDIIRDTLSEWKKERYQPNVIPIQLRHKYAPSSHFHSGSFGDPDDILFSCLNTVARELGLKLFVAHIEHVQGSTWSLQLDEHIHTEWCPLNRNDEDDSASEIEQPCTCHDTQEHILAFLDQFDGDNPADEFDEEHGPRVTINEVFEVGGIDGAVLSSGSAMSLPGVKFEAPDIIRDAQFGMNEDDMLEAWTRASNEQYGRGPPDKREFEELANEKSLLSGYLKQAWRNTVLLICPNIISTASYVSPKLKSV
ncbi:hypothetical protein BDZ89DRAFT_1068973 [Hymenopellis radicata]|nr:hypothetical protein BDZ89DRAFT_1068973 [Hymenopellis radicata]